MKKMRLKFPSFTLITAMLLPFSLLAQEVEKEIKVEKDVKEKNKIEEVVIVTKKTGDTKEKTVIEINGDNITVNGKPLEEYKSKDGNVSVRRQKVSRLSGSTSTSPRRIDQGHGLIFNDDMGTRFFKTNENKALLGVTTEKTENGVKVISVSKESAAEKSGLKEGDIISKIDDQKINNPDDLSKAIGGHKPGDKVKVTYSRDKKEKTTTAELTEWKGISGFGNIDDNAGNKFEFDFEGLGDLNSIMPKLQQIPQMRGFGQNWSWSGGSPKLGLSVQDTDDGKGVKVIEVDDESNAQKAGIKEDDVITEADGKAINSTDDMVKLIKESKDKNSIMVKLMRDGKTQNIEVKIPKKIKTVDL